MEFYVIKDLICTDWLRQLELIFLTRISAQWVILNGHGFWPFYKISRESAISNCYKLSVSPNLNLRIRTCKDFYRGCWLSSSQYPHSYTYSVVVRIARSSTKATIDLGFHLKGFQRNQLRLRRSSPTRLYPWTWIRRSSRSAHRGYPVAAESVYFLGSHEEIKSLCGSLIPDGSCTLRLQMDFWFIPKCTLHPPYHQRYLQERTALYLLIRLASPPEPFLIYPTVKICMLALWSIHSSTSDLSMRFTLHCFTSRWNLAFCYSLWLHCSANSTNCQLTCCAR